jgi:Lsr2
VTRIDDLSGEPAEHTVALAFNGQAVELDLDQENLDKLEKTLEPYLSAGRKVSRNATNIRRRRSGGGGSSVQHDADPKAVRAWAASRGIDVSPRGRVSAALIAQFHEAAN